MIKWMLPGVFALVFVAQGWTQSKNSTPEEFGKSLTKALKLKDEYKIRDHYLNYDDYVAMMAAVSKVAGIPSQADKGEFSFIKARFTMNIDEVLSVGKKRGLDWKKIEFKEIKYGKSEMLDSLELADMELYFQAVDTLYGIQLKSCVKVAGSWKIGERINWKYNKMSDNNAQQIDGSKVEDKTTKGFSDASTKALMDKLFVVLQENDRSKIEACYMDSVDIVHFINLTFTGIENSQAQPDYSRFYQRFILHQQQSLDQMASASKTAGVEWSKIKMDKVHSEHSIIDNGKAEVLHTDFTFISGGKKYLIKLESMKLGDQWKLGEMLWKGVME